MNRMMRWTILALSLAVSMSPTLPAGASPTNAPAPVEQLSKKWLPHAQYERLRDEWKAWAEAHPADAHGWAQAAKAGAYAGDPIDLMQSWAEKAYALAPDAPETCELLARYRWETWGRGPAAPDEAIRLLEHALAANPDLDNARVRMWVLQLARGDRAAAEAQLRSLLDRGRIPEPLTDYNWNELAGLAPNAILFTNGDNDTYPAVALQAARGFRTDVTVINLSMLNLGWYRRMLREGAHPVAAPLLENVPLEDVPSRQAMKEILRTYVKPGSSRPVYMAVTVPMRAEDVGAKLSLEGLVYRVKPGKPESLADTSRLELNLGSLYRMQSATSPALDWDEWSALRSLCPNYAAAWAQLALALNRAGHRAAASRAMNRVLELATFHHDEQAKNWLGVWRSIDPASKDLARWSRRVGK